ncbi:hypothetical protein [Streptococcus parasuis]
MTDNYNSCVKKDITSF